MFKVYLAFQVLLWDLEFFLRGSLKVPCSKVSGTPLNLSFAYVQNTFTLAFKFHLLAGNFLEEENSVLLNYCLIIGI